MRVYAGPAAAKASGVQGRPKLDLPLRQWLAVTVALASAAELLLTQGLRRPSLFDFHMYLNAAWAARLGGTIYPDPSLGAGVHAVLPGAHYFIYPVPFVLLLVPLTLIPTWAADLCARFGEIALLTLAAWALVRAFAPSKREVERAAWAAAALFHLPIIVRVDNLGQADAAILALAALSLLSASRGTPRGEWLGGLALGAAALIKPYIGFLVIFFLWKRQWRAAASTLGTAGAGVGIGILALGWPDTANWLHSASSALGAAHASATFTVSLYGLAVRSVLAFRPALLPTVQPFVTVAAVGLVGVGLLAGARFIQPRYSSAFLTADERALRYGWDFALAITLLLLILPPIEDLHTSLVAIPVVLLGLLAAQTASNWLQVAPERTRAFWWVLVLSALLMLYLTLTSSFLAGWWQALSRYLPIWTALNSAHETVAWLAVPVALALLIWVYAWMRRGKTPRAVGIALFLWSLAAVFSVRVSPIEYGEQAQGTGFHLLAGLVCLGTIAAVSIALIVAARLGLVPQGVVPEDFVLEGSRSPGGHGR